MPNRNCFPRCWCSFKVFADRVIKAEPAFLDEQHDSRGDELLTDGRDLVDGIRRGRDLAFDTRQAITLGLNDFAVFDHSQGKAWDMLTLHLGLNEVVYWICLPDGLIRLHNRTSQQQQQS